MLTIASQTASLERSRFFSRPRAFAKVTVAFSGAATGMVEQILMWLGVGIFGLAGISAWCLAARSMMRTPIDWLGPSQEFSRRVSRERRLVLLGFGSMCIAAIPAFFLVVLALR